MTQRQEQQHDHLEPAECIPGPPGSDEPTDIEAEYKCSVCERPIGDDERFVSHPTPQGRKEICLTCYGA